MPNALSIFSIVVFSNNCKQTTRCVRQNDEPYGKDVSPSNDDSGVYKEFIVSLIFRLNALLLSVCANDWRGRLDYTMRGKRTILSCFIFWAEFFLKEVLGLSANEETPFMLDNLSS